VATEWQQTEPHSTGPRRNAASGNPQSQAKMGLSRSQWEYPYPLKVEGSSPSRPIQTALASQICEARFTSYLRDPAGTGDQAGSRSLGTFSVRGNSSLPSTAITEIPGGG
jgi:hypothetical protein